VLFVLSTCPFCMKFRPLFESFARQREADCTFLTVVLDDIRCPLWDEYQIDVVPTVIIFRGNRVEKRIDGRPGEGLDSGDLDSL